MLSKIACIFSGLLTIFLTYYQPPAYWNNASRKWSRHIMGDAAAAISHYAIGGLLIWLGIIIW